MSLAEDEHVIQALTPDRPGIGVDVAEPFLRGQLQGGVLPERLPGREDVIGSYLTDKDGHLRDVVRPLQEKQETVYVVASSDAEEHVARRSPLKTITRVGNGLRVRSIQRFLPGLHLTFQRGKASKLNAVYHFTFTGKEPKEATATTGTAPCRFGTATRAKQTYS